MGIINLWQGKPITIAAPHGMACVLFPPWRRYAYKTQRRCIKAGIIISGDSGGGAEKAIPRRILAGTKHAFERAPVTRRTVAKQKRL